MNSPLSEKELKAMGAYWRAISTLSGENCGDGV
jgi:hypothetical protein